MCITAFPHSQIAEIAERPAIVVGDVVPSSDTMPEAWQSLATSLPSSLTNS